MKSLEIVSYRNNSPASGWGLIFVAGVLFVTRGFVDKVLHERILSGLSALASVAGGWTFLWAPKRVLRSKPGSKFAVIDETSRFGKKSRVIPVDAISAVLVNSWIERDRDTRPRTYYWVVLRLHTAEELDVTDRTLIEGDAEKLRREIEAALIPQRRHG